MRDALQRTHEEPKRKRIRQCLNFPDSVEPSTSGEVTPPKTNSLEEPSSNKKTFEVVEPVVEKKLAIEQRKATPQDVDIELVGYFCSDMIHSQINDRDKVNVFHS